MKIKDGFVLEEVAGSYIAVALGASADEFHGFVKMNSTGVFLWNLLREGDVSEDELVAKLLEQYEVSEDVAREDVKKLCKKLLDAKIAE